MSHIPGIFHAQSRLQPEVRVIVSQPDEDALLKLTANAAVDLGIITLPRSLPGAVEVIHRMSDVFSLVAPKEMESPAPDAPPPAIRKWMTSRTWLLPPAGSSVREVLEAGLAPLRVSLDPMMELESFDLMLQFVSMGMGCAFVPRRSLAGFPRRKRIRIVALPMDVRRTLVVVAPSATKVPEHVATFIDGILFS